jgi:hypothetical protein
MNFNTVSAVEEKCWDMRIADQPRAEDRKVLLRLYNGNPPFDEATADENNIQINRNNLIGPNMLSMSRRQWNGAFLRPSHFFTAKPDSGPAHKRMEWSNFATAHANRLLKRDRRMVGQVKATGANTLLYGIGPVNWKDRRSVIPTPIPVSSLLVPSETTIDDFDESLECFAIFREWTLSQLYDMTHGPKVDPGWNMKVVQSAYDYIKDDLRKSPNSLAFQYMPERIEELNKQDKGLYGSDAVPTVDVWDFYHKSEDGKSWYRKVILDWNAGVDVSTYSSNGTRPDSKNDGFLYSSGSRKYANSASEIIHCQFGDCSPYAPVKFHSARGLGWMLWGVCDSDNRLDCKVNEAAFEQTMWFFQTAGNQDMIRLKKANFEHMGIIPQGIKFLTANERFTPNAQLIQMVFDRNRRTMADSSTTYTQDYDKGGEARTATETMAIVNASQALASGVLEMAYTYEAFKYREMFRRLCLKNSTDPMAREFRLNCLKDGIPEDLLEAEKWSIEPEQVLGGGNKTLQMATVGFLNSIRQNLPPDGQRIVDHISVEAATDQPDLAEEIAPLGENKPISNSTNVAQLATDRIMRGLPFTAPKDAIYEDYVTVWLQDMGITVQRIFQKGGMATPDEMSGLMNLANGIPVGNGGRSDCISKYLEIMGKNKSEKEKVRQFQDVFGQLMNHVKGIAQRLQQAMQKQGDNGQGAQGPDPKDMAKVQGMMIQAQTKSKIAEQNAANKLRQKEEQFQAAEKRKDLQTATDIQRTGIVTRHELMANRMKALQVEPEPAKTE